MRAKEKNLQQQKKRRMRVPKKPRFEWGKREGGNKRDKKKGTGAEIAENRH